MTDNLRLEGINHVTAITGDAPLNVDFYTRVLGLRLVTKTVNQDDPTVYHLFYADEDGSAGADMTFFEYPGAAPGPSRARDGLPGDLARRVARIARLLGRAPCRARDPSHRERSSVLLADPEGLEHELIVEDVPDAPLRAHHPEIPAEHALLGFSGVRAYSLREDSSRPCSSRCLELVRATRAISSCAATLAAARSPSTWRPDTRAHQGGGSIHHVAWGTTVAEHPLWLPHLKRGRNREHADHRPPFLPLDLLPRARWDPLRDRRRRSRLRPRRPGQRARPQGRSCRPGWSPAAARSRDA